MHLYINGFLKQYLYLKSLFMGKRMLLCGSQLKLTMLQIHLERRALYTEFKTTVWKIKEKKTQKLSLIQILLI